MRFADLNLCERYSVSQEQRVRFAQNYERRCRVSLQQMLEDFSEPEFFNLYADYYDQKARLLRSIPVLVRKAFSHNDHVDPEKWQLVKRFLMVDSLSGLNENYKPKMYCKNPLHERYSFVRYVKKVEFEIRLHTNHDKNPNRVAVPLLKLEYGLVNMSQWKSTSFLEETVDFEFRIIFSKKYNFDSLLEVRIILVNLMFFD